MAGTTRQQAVGRIKEVADCGDEDIDEDEIPSNSVLLTALVERFCVSRVRDLFCNAFFVGHRHKRIPFHLKKSFFSL